MSGLNLKTIFARQKAATRDVVDAVEEVRLRVITLQDERQQIKRLPVSRQRAIDALDEGLAAAVDRLDVRMLVSGLLRPADGRPHFRLDRIPENLIGPWLATLAADRLRALFIDEIDNILDGRDDLPENQRPAAIAKLDAEILSLELVEERMIRTAEAAGIPVLRRADLDARAALAADSALPGG